MTDHRHEISQEATLLEALRRLNGLSGGAMTLFAHGNEGRITGTLTDGDVRRALLRGIGLEQPVAQAMRREFRSLSLPVSLAALRHARQLGIRLLPLLDAEGRLADIVDLKRQDTQLPLSAILMAGGRGERLRPATLTTPKPLLKIDGRPIIDYNIERLARAGIFDVTVTVNYLASQLEEYFSVPHWGISVKCVREPEFMGTIGAAALVKRQDPQGHTLVMNSDLLTTISLEEMFLQHREASAQVTIAAVPYAVSVPYAILTTDARGRVSALEEKPTYSHLANAGIYIFANSLLDTLPPAGRTDAPDFITEAIGHGLTVSSYPIAGTWIDIGSPADFRHAEDLMRHVNSLHP